MSGYFEVLRYGAAGVVNTAVGYAVFWVMLRLLGVGPALSNAAGYAVALAVAYVINRRYVFVSSHPRENAPLLFIGAFLAAFTVNQLVLRYGMNSLSLMPEVAQLLAMAGYTVFFYLLNKFLVYKDVGGQGKDSAADREPLSWRRAVPLLGKSEQGGDVRRLTLVALLFLVMVPPFVGYAANGLWGWDLSVPLVYRNPGHDEVWQLTLTKMLLDTGWVLQTPFMGAPASADWHYHSAAQTSAIHSVLMLLLSPLFADAVSLQQAYYLLNFSLIALCTFALCAWLGIGRVVAVCVGIIFAFNTFRFSGGFLAFLANYFAVPLALLPVIDGIRGRYSYLSTMAGGRGVRAVQEVVSSKSFIVGCVCVAVVATSDGYYSFFTLLLLGFALVVRIAMGDFRRWPSLVPFVVYIGIVLFAVLALMAPLNSYRESHPDEFMPGGKIDPALVKHPAEAEVYISTLKVLIAPIANHRVDWLAGVGSYMVATANEFRRIPVSQVVPLGTLGAVLLVAVLFSISLPFRYFRLNAPNAERGGELPVYYAAASVAFFGFLCSITGGVGTIVALVYPTIRAYDRFPLFLLLALLIGAAAIVSSWLKSASPGARARGMIGLVAITMLAVVDQVPKDADKTDESRRQLFYGERAVVAKLEESLPDGAMVYQYPYSQYLSDSKYYGWGAFSHLRLYLHSQTLRWSNGASKNSPVDNWHRVLAEFPFDVLIRRVHDAGFRAVVFDRSVIGDEEFSSIVSAAERYAGGEVQYDPAAKLAWVMLPDRGFHFAYDEGFQRIQDVVVTDIGLARRSELSAALDPLAALEVFMTDADGVPIRFPADTTVAGRRLVKDDSEVLLGGRRIPDGVSLQGKLSCAFVDPVGGVAAPKVKINLVNQGSSHWLLGTGEFPIKVGVHLRDMDGSMVLWDNGYRVPGRIYLEPGGAGEWTIALADLGIDANMLLGRARMLEFAVVQDGHRWYSDLSCTLPV